MFSASVVKTIDILKEGIANPLSWTAAQNQIPAIITRRPFTQYDLTYYHNLDAPIKLSTARIVCPSGHLVRSDRI